MITSNFIPTNQLSPNALTAVFDSLQPLGFLPEKMIEQDFAYSDREGKQITTNLLVFTHETFRSPDYRGLTVFSPVNGFDEALLAQSLAQSAAPFHLIHHHQTQRFSFWFTNISRGDPQRVNARLYEPDIDYSKLPRVMERYGSDINPQRITDVNQGRDYFKQFEHEGAFQLALWAIEVTGNQLVEHFGKAVELLRSENVPNKTIPDLATQLLGATILAHTGALGPEPRKSDSALDILITLAHKRFPSYFEPKLFEQWQEALHPAYRILTELRYANFAPELLTRLYQEAFPTVVQRRELGRYDTPLYLTRRIWETIPIEFLAPEKRIIADMTCGWGSFLISGHERLSRMIDMEDRPLRDHLFGNDSDLFTSRLAGLGLLISTLQDRWYISNRDALEWKGPDTQPTIVVGNPPFHGSRRRPSAKHAESLSRFEKANQFLDHAIDILAPDGYLAMLMPQSFVASEASPILRKKLLERCDVLEMWELPLGVFEAQANSVVMFAQKHSEVRLSSQPVRVRAVQAKQLNAFKEQGVFTASSLVNSQGQWDVRSRRSRHSNNTHIFDYRMILPQLAWEKLLSDCRPLIELAVIFSGTIRGSLDRNEYRNHTSGQRVKWFSQPRNVINGPFQIVYDDPQTLLYPNDFEWPRLDRRQFLEGPKVLCNALANPSWGKRIKAVIDRKGYHFSDNFVVMAPRDQPESFNITLEVIAAVVDWKVSNAWLLEHHKHTRFPMRAIHEIPFPKLTDEECQQLSSAVANVEEEWQLRMRNAPDSLQAIDGILRKAYQLDDETYERLSLIAEWDTSSSVTLDRQFDPTALWEISGVVDSVDAESGRITLWLGGFDRLQTVPIVPPMPGWLLRPEAAFRTSIPLELVNQHDLRGNTSWGYFYPQDYAYLDEAELLAQLAETLS